MLGTETFTSSRSGTKEDWKAKVPTVSQLTRSIRGHLEGSFGNVWVRGEISSFRKPVSGHGYFLLKDETSQLRSVIFRHQLSRHRFEIEDGMEVLLHGTITVYEARGEYQIVCDTIEPVGIGALQLAFEQLKEKLNKEGLFDPKHKKPLPYLPRRIGVVTSATGAAIKDILHVLSRRFPRLEVLLIPASVQGAQAAPEIVGALEDAVQWNKTYPDRCLDLLIVGRGGGSLEDLWPFNEEIVARAIYNCPIPIISAVGHEIDFTISDFVADVRAPTPSAAAEIAVPVYEDLLQSVENQKRRLITWMRGNLQQKKLHLTHLSRRLVSPLEKIRQQKERFARLEKQLVQVFKARLDILKQKLTLKIQLLHSLSPLEVIGRGYSLSQTPEGKIVRSVKEISPGQILETRLKDGRFKSQVLSLLP